MDGLAEYGSSDSELSPSRPGITVQGEMATCSGMRCSWLYEMRSDYTLAVCHFAADAGVVSSRATRDTALVAHGAGHGEILAVSGKSLRFNATYDEMMAPGERPSALRQVDAARQLLWSVALKFEAFGASTARCISALPRFVLLNYASACFTVAGPEKLTDEAPHPELPKAQRNHRAGHVQMAHMHAAAFDSQYNAYDLVGSGSAEGANGETKTVSLLPAKRKKTAEERAAARKRREDEAREAQALAEVTGGLSWRFPPCSARAPFLDSMPAPACRIARMCALSRDFAGGNAFPAGQRGARVDEPAKMGPCRSGRGGKSVRGRGWGGDGGSEGAGGRQGHRCVCEGKEKVTSGFPKPRSAIKCLLEDKRRIRSPRGCIDRCNLERLAPFQFQRCAATSCGAPVLKRTHTPSVSQFRRRGRRASST